MDTVFARILHPKRYDRRRGRFTSQVFKPSTNQSGISAIDVACARSKNDTICSHIREYYENGIAGEPIMFWKFDAETLPSGHTLEQEVGSTGDPCHYNIRGLTKKNARDFFVDNYENHFSDFHICTDDGKRQLIQSDLDNLPKE